MSERPPLNEIAIEYDLCAKIAGDFGVLYQKEPTVGLNLLLRLLAAVGAAPEAVPTGSPTRATPMRDRGAMANFIKIAQAIREAGSPLTREQLQAKTGITSNRIHTVLYRSCKTHFRSVPLEGSGRAKGFDLTPEGIAALEKGWAA